MAKKKKITRKDKIKLTSKNICWKCGKTIKKDKYGYICNNCGNTYYRI